MEQETNSNEQLAKQLQETNHRLQMIQNILVGILRRCWYSKFGN